MSAWRWLWAWFGEPERPPRRRPGSPVGDAVIGRGAATGERAPSRQAGASRRARRPLPPATRAELESALGADLADLSLTIDPGFTAALDARAVQLGSTIVVGDPADARARPLLAHEATHALQARRSGTRPGVGSPGEASERAAARTGDAFATGSRPPPAPSGPPVAAIQRQAAAPGKTRGAGERDPAAIQAMLMIAYAKQGGQGDFTWSDELAAAFRRLLPGVALARLESLWQPPPGSPGEALARLQAAGVLAAAAHAPSAAVPETPPASAPQPLEEAAALAPPELEPAVEEPAPLRLEEPATDSLEVTVVVILPKGLPEALARAGPALRRGFRLDARQLRALRSDRSQARQVYDGLFADASLDANARAGLAELLADLAWQSSVAAHGTARAAPATAPGSPWHTVAGGLVAAGPFGELLAALARLTAVSATLRFKP